MTMNRAILAAACAAFLAGPAFAFDTVEDLTAGYIAAVAAEDLEAVKLIYAEPVDAFLTKGGIAKSRDEIAAVWAELFAAYDNISMTADEIGAVATDTTHTGWGTFGMKGTPAGGGEETVWTGNYMIVSVKSEDGWHYRADLAPITLVSGGGAAEAPAVE